jgi:hypothetical protein
MRRRAGFCLRPGGGPRRTVAGRSLRDEFDRPGTPGGVIALDGEQSCAGAGRRDRFATRLSVYSGGPEIVCASTPMPQELTGANPSRRPREGASGALLTVNSRRPAGALRDSTNPESFSDSHPASDRLRPDPFCCPDAPVGADVDRPPMRGKRNCPPCHVAQPHPSSPSGESILMSRSMAAWSRMSW